VLERKMTWALDTALAAALIAVTIAGVGLVTASSAAANACGASCRSAYNQCRMQTKGSSACESQFTQCMQSCIRK
jgi:hypothetical protein